jgi:hypothetical protein
VVASVELPVVDASVVDASVADAFTVDPPVSSAPVELDAVTAPVVPVVGVVFSVVTPLVGGSLVDEVGSSPEVSVGSTPVLLALPVPSVVGPVVAAPPPGHPPARREADNHAAIRGVVFGMGLSGRFIVCPIP